MKASTINKTTFTLRKQCTTKVAGTISYDPTTDTATLDPTNSLKSGVGCKAVVTTGAKDVEGTQLDQNTTTTGLQQKVWFFTVRP